MTIVEAKADAMTTIPGGGPYFFIVRRENLLAAHGRAEFKATVTCWGMHWFAWRLKRALSNPSFTCVTIGPENAERIAEFLDHETLFLEPSTRKAVFRCLCGEDHYLIIMALRGGYFHISFREGRLSKLFWRLRDALWPKDYALSEILLTAGQAARLAAFLRRWNEDV